MDSINNVELEKDLEIITELQCKYSKMLREHMSLKKEQRKDSWDIIRTKLFHLNGTLSMARSAFATYIKK